ncbi:MAG: ABC transporter substrate-binding protein [Vicinamibacterales bacterium]|nr:ABC transporter substrate-binding protein [Vicinamibacterales bacterium]
MLSIGLAGAGRGDGLNQLVLQLTSDSLIRSGPDGRIEEMLASDWSVDPDGTAVTVTLRQDVTFHDGSPLTAHDVKTTLDQARQSAYRVGRDPLLSDIESIKIMGLDQVRIALSRPSGQMLLPALGIYIVKQRGEGESIPSGPFILEPDTVEETTLRVNPNYYQGRSDIDTVRIKTFSSVRNAWAAMMRSEIDFLYDVPIGARQFVEADPSVRVFSLDTPYAYALLFNTSRPPFDDPRVRVALSYAVDRHAVLDRAFRGHGSITSGLWTSHWVYGGKELIYGYDPQRADRLLSEAGLYLPTETQAAGIEGFPNRLRFETLVGLDLAPMEPIALIMQQQLRQIGVDMETDAKPLFVDVAAQLLGDDWDAALVPLNMARNLSRLYAFWHSSQPLFDAGFNQADAALDRLRSSVTEEDVVSSAGAFQQIMFDQAPGIFLNRPEQARAVSRRFIVPDTPERDIIETLWQWQVDEGWSTK